MIRDINTHAIPFSDANARPRHLVVECIGQHLLMRQDVSLDHRGLQIEHFHAVLDLRLEWLITPGIGGRGIADRTRIHRGHVAHRFGRRVVGHDHSRRHDRAFDRWCADAEIGIGGTENQRNHQRQRGWPVGAVSSCMSDSIRVTRAWRLLCAGGCQLRLSMVAAVGQRRHPLRTCRCSGGR